LFEQILNGEVQPTKVLCTPGMLGNVTRVLGRHLGQKGLMPTVKRGGVGEGEELAQRIREARGAMDWMSTKEGLILTRELTRVLPDYADDENSYSQGGPLCVLERGHPADLIQTHFPLSQVEANVRALTASVRAVFAANAPENTDEAIGVRKKSKKSASDVLLRKPIDVRLDSGIQYGYLTSANGPSIELRDF
jgi:hypothetical protein